jgi:hypothetical protein
LEEDVALSGSDRAAQADLLRSGGDGGGGAGKIRDCAVSEVAAVDTGRLAATAIAAAAHAY